MDRCRCFILRLVLPLFCLVVPLLADTTLSGTQIRARAQMNGELKCPGVTLAKGAVITAVTEPGAGYWLEGPHGALLKFGGRNTGVGTALAAGTWKVFPNLPAGVDTASVSLTLREGATGGGGAATVAGTWRVVFKGGTIDAASFLELHQNGSAVTGTLKAPDGSRGEVKGTLTGNRLELSRDTGLQTIQHYRVTVDGARFSGTFHNEGRYPDRGSFAGVLVESTDGRHREEEAPSGVGGTWTVHFRGGTVDTSTTLVLTQTGTAVSGQLQTPDGSRSAVKGTFSGRDLVLSRDTGLETVQHYRVTVTGNRFTGTFLNVGKYKDQGTFEGVRR